MLSQIENNPVICIDINKAYSFYNLLNNLKCITISCRTEWEVIRNEIKNTKCQMECNHTIKRYQYEGKCYDTCPKIAPYYIFLEELERKIFNCVPRCPLEYPFEKIETHNCVDSCNLTEREKEICQINYMPNDTNNKEVEDKELENIKNILTNGFNTSDIGNGKNLIIKQRDSTITITNTENQKKPSNLTTIDLGKCEKELKREYGIPENEPLYILKIDVKKEGLKIPKIAYEVYYPYNGGNLTKLNLTVCQDSDIKLSLYVVLSDDIDLINPSSKYYNDICYTYTSEDGTDIILSDRKFNFVNNNLTVCEEDCDFNGYNYTTRKAICSCSVKMNSTTKIGDIAFEKNKLFDSFTNFKNIANINVLKCYKLIFKLEAFKYNYGNLILLVIIIFLFISFFIFYFKENYDLEKILNIIVFFKLNLHLVKKFLQRKKREEQIKLNNIKKRIKNKRKAKLNDKKGKIEDLNLPPPIYSVYLKLRKKNLLNKEEVRNFDLFFENENINTNSTINNNKRSQKLISNLLETNNKSSMRMIIDKNNKRKNENNTIINKKNYPYNMNENQLYEMFLKIYKKSDSEMNELSYDSAIKLDNRTYFQYYLSLLRTKHLFIFSFWPAFDYNPRIIKKFLFFFNFTLSFVFNALFFDDETMHKIYEDKGSFDFIYNIPQIILSSIISGFINGIIETLALTDSLFISLKEEIYIKDIIIKKQKTLKMIKIKLLLFFIITLLLLILFWFYLACFCAVYKNTQIHLITDTVTSFGTSMITPFGFYLLPGIFRIVALKAKKKIRKLCLK